MNKRDYELTERNLVFMDLFEPFYNLYITYKTILTDKLREMYTINKRAIFTNQLYRETNQMIRSLFNAFLKEYTYVFTDEFSCLYVDTIFMNRVNIYHIKDVPSSPTKVEYYFSSFKQFLCNLEFAVVYSVHKRKTKELPKLREERVLQDINKRICDQAAKGKCSQFVDAGDEIQICEKLIVYEDLKMISCNQKNHLVLSGFAYCKLNDRKHVRLPIHICQDCSKHFIGIHTLKIYENIYGKLIVSRICDNEYSQIDFNEFGKSDLYKTGYNAKENGMTDYERQMFLKHLIDTNQLSYFEIIRDLEGAIRWHRSKHSDRFAVERWRKDLEYINNLMQDDQSQ